MNGHRVMTTGDSRRAWSMGSGRTESGAREAGRRARVLRVGAADVVQVVSAG